MARDVLSITQVNEYIRSVLDRDGLLSNVAVRGEISNYKQYPSGHHYFTLKDEGGALKCVMFKANALRMRFRPENGMKVIAMGKVSVYPRDGAYQLYCSAMVVDGIGDLHAAFEQLKAKLGAMGLFDPSHKKPIPKFPGMIGIVTSEAGAAVHDMLRILNKRYPLSKVRLFPVRVQGAEAPGEIAAAIRYANYHNLADVLIVGRGGGSIEDLWAFNDERVAFAIYESRIPVISAVGHEPDVTISDYVADLRAATPSNAAELVVPDQVELRKEIRSLHLRMLQAVQRPIHLYRQRLQNLENARAIQKPLDALRDRQLYLDCCLKDLAAAAQKHISDEREKFVGLVSALDAMSPFHVLARGYSVTKTQRGAVRNASEVSVGEKLSIVLYQGEIEAQVLSIQEGKHG